MGSVLGCCSVNVTEIYAGMREVEQDKTEKLINKLRFFPIDLKVAKLAGDMIRSYKSKGITLSPTDAMIAAVAIYNDLILITNNKKHYPMKEIKSISPKDI
jgi:predicted nucleic acid-binding protein